MANPLLDDRTVDFIVGDVLAAGRLLELPAYAAHGADTFAAYVDLCRRFAREVLFPCYPAMDREPPRLVDGQVVVHRMWREVWPRLCELGVISPTRSSEVGGQELPLTIATAGAMYLYAGNVSVAALAGLTAGVAHLVEAFGAPWMKERYLAPLMQGRWTGTMALTEPHAGSSLSDAATRARPEGDHHLLRGSKIFISGGDHDLGENIVHAVLARVDGAPTGSKGLSLFLVPKRRPAGGTLVPNDVHVAGLIHKIGWRGLPSVILSLGEADACHGWLLGEEGRGLAYMFQLINEARLAVGVTATSTASVAYQESLAYAQERRQGRAVGADPHGPQVPIIEHADVRRMLLRQKAIVEGAQGLVLRAARSADLARNALTREERDRAQLLLDLLIPVVKAFAAERGYEANALALQIHGGYGYSSELPLEAWLRDQKLNSIHEGTTGIQGLDLLGRRALAGKGAALAALELEGEATCARAAAAGVDPAWTESVRRVRRELTAVTAELAAHGARGDPRRMLRRSAEYLELFSTWAVAWQWLEHSAAAAEARASGARPEAFCDGQLAAARYWMSAELPRAEHLLALCRSDDDGLAALPAESF